MLRYATKHLGGIDREAVWKKIITLYADELPIPDIARRFNMTAEGVRYGLRKRHLLRERKTKCAAN